MTNTALSAVSAAAVLLMPVQIVTGPEWRLDGFRTLHVEDPAETAPVVVVWGQETRPTGDPLWGCALCGISDTASCAHTFSAAFHLSQTLLGLTAVPELTNHPTD